MVLVAGIEKLGALATMPGAMSCPVKHCTFDHKTMLHQ